ncbi:MAG: type II secretion system protein, partial [Erysipelotrichia bacterium]|nr:type II secretion system protein [Erysipelotrichia bacterium]
MKLCFISTLKSKKKLLKMMQTKKQTKKSGFTLVETLISLTLLA